MKCKKIKTITSLMLLAFMLVWISLHDVYALNSNSFYIDSKTMNLYYQRIETIKRVATERLMSFSYGVDEGSYFYYSKPEKLAVSEPFIICDINNDTQNEVYELPIYDVIETPKVFAEASSVSNY